MAIFDGIKVLELARVPPAEMPGMFLADYGADVLKSRSPAARATSRKSGAPPSRS
jgi:crotonobetainyl-CoA:carnitine CoA-transferase CaiB-like acyl-CoA transferase